MELVCQDYVLYAEPIRVILHGSNISFKETPSSGDLKDIQLITEDKEIIQNYQEIIQYVSDQSIKSSQWQQSNANKSPSEAAEFNNAHLQKIVATYLQIADAVLAEQPLTTPADKLIKEYVDLIAERQFLAGKAWTPLDAIFHEIIKTLDVINKRPRNDLLYKYTERFGTVELIRSYLIDSKTYLRPLTDKIDNRVVSKRKVLEPQIPILSDFLMCKGGILSRLKHTTDSPDPIEVSVHLPYSLIPKRISKQEFLGLINIQEKWNFLVNAMARDFDWYTEKLEYMLKTEDFVRRLHDIAKKCRAYPHTQKITCSLVRNDYMYQSAENRWLQVEYNVFAAGMAPYCDKIQKIQKLVRNNYFEDEDVEQYNSGNMKMTEEGLVEAFKCYGNPNAVVVMIVPGKHETTILMQRAIEKKLFENKIKCIRASLRDVYENHKFDEATGTLYMNGQEVGLVYFRAGYHPDHYANENDWRAREVIELSRAVKSPNVDYQLINFKIFQLYLAQDAVLARFFRDQEERNLIRKNFANFWEINDPAKVPELLKMVEANPRLYVLKPQREGGTNNFFDEEIIHLFKTLSFKELSTHILMEKIDSTPHIGLMVRNRELAVAPCISEVGIYGYVLSDSEKLIKSMVAGYVVRTKMASSNECGLVAGWGVLDTLVLE